MNWIIIAACIVLTPFVLFICAKMITYGILSAKRAYNEQHKPKEPDTEEK